MGKISQNIWFFEFIEKLGQYFFLNLIHNESLYYLLNIDPIFGKNLLHQNMGHISGTKFTGFWNEIYLHNKMMKYLIFC